MAATSLRGGVRHMSQLSASGIKPDGDLQISGEDGARHVALALARVSEQPGPCYLDRLAHEYGLKDTLNAAWAVRPPALTRERGRTMLMLKDPGGEPPAFFSSRFRTVSTRQLEWCVLCPFLANTPHQRSTLPE
jgi:hypothetical protein